MLWVVLRTTISGWTNERTNAAGPGAVVQSCEVKDSTSRRRRPGAAGGHESTRTIDHKHKQAPSGRGRS
jgi:hypothetical protein